MPRYFFDIHDGDGDYRDDVGVDLNDMTSAIAEARRALADMVRDTLRDSAGETVRVNIRDGAEGPVQLTVTLKTVTPADRAAGHS